YKVEYVSTSPDHHKWYKVKNPVDTWTLIKELEALLKEYAAKGYSVISTEAVISPNKMGQNRTDGIVVIFEKL
ncbi:MAG: hypothetical protein AAGK97_10740, partial [Bacteroidota bacterium]